MSNDGSLSTAHLAPASALPLLPAAASHCVYAALAPEMLGLLALVSRTIAVTSQTNPVWQEVTERALWMPGLQGMDAKKRAALVRMRSQHSSWPAVLQLRARLRTTGTYILRHCHHRPRAKEWVDEMADGAHLPYIAVRWQRLLRFWPDGTCRYARTNVDEAADLTQLIDPSRGRRSPRPLDARAARDSPLREGTFVRKRDVVVVNVVDGKNRHRFELRITDVASRTLQLVKHTVNGDMILRVGEDDIFVFSTWREMDERREGAADVEAPVVSHHRRREQLRSAKQAAAAAR